VTNHRRRAAAVIPAGVFELGGRDPDANVQDGEGPVRRVELSAFAIDRYAVTNADFSGFVAATGYVTTAERAGWSFVFGGSGGTDRRLQASGAPWWHAVSGANWHDPEGPGSGVDARPRHPVVHVSWDDANAYCTWVGGGLPTEAQWEAAARGGRQQTRFPWGEELEEGGRHHCNVWQGEFPTLDVAADGHVGTAPVDAYEANGYGLCNMIGNVWEWTADWWSATWHSARGPATRRDPLGPPRGTERSIRGGSYLCHASYCNRYRLAARSHNTPDSTASNLGFRCAAAG
jgi:formylglycine-generating enzyme